MAIYNNNLREVVEIFKYFRESFFEKKECIFTGEKVYTLENIEQYRKQIIVGFDPSDRSNQAKYREQIIKGQKESKTFHLFFTNLFYLYDLFRNTSIELKYKRLKFYLNFDLNEFEAIKYDKTSSESDEKIQNILNNTDNLNIELDEKKCSYGIISSTSYNTNMYFELNFIFVFLEKALSNNNIIKILNNINFTDVVSDETTSSRVIKRFGARNVLLYLFFPDKYEPILSYKDKESIVSYYLGACSKDNLIKLDEDLFKIREKLKINKVGFYDSPYNKWQENKKIYISQKKRLNEIDDISNSDILEGKEFDAVVKKRIGQSAFRKELLRLYKNKCCICNIHYKELLVASHIKPWSESDAILKTDYKSNGLLLCTLHDKLFDSGLISFDKYGKVLISSKIKQEDYLELKINKSLELGFEIITKMKHNLEYHRNKKFEK